MASIKTSVLGELDWYNTLRDYFSQCHLNGDRILTSAGMPSTAEFNQPRQYYSDGVSRAFQEFGRLTGNPASGLQHYHPLRQLGVLSHVMQAAATVEMALTQAARYLHLFWPMAYMGLRPNANNGTITLSLTGGKVETPGELYDFAITGVINALKIVSAVQPKILQISRPGAEPTDATPWQTAFGCKVLFNASECSITLDPSYMQLSVPTANNTVYAFCTNLLEQIAQQRGHTIKAHIRAILPAHLARGKVRREAIASMLCMSERTLCRRIASEGTTFAYLVDDLRRDLAQSHMQQGYSPTQIAYSLGFSDPSNFYRACRRWFGKTPAHLNANSFLNTISV